MSSSPDAAAGGTYIDFVRLLHLQPSRLRPLADCICIDFVRLLLMITNG